jgi:uncharacterized membrane protein YgcG
MDEDMFVTEAGDFEIERRLESYARARLSADPQVVARIRARVMREARLQADAPRVAAPDPLTARRARRMTPRRVSVGFLAAAVWLGVAAGSIFAAQAGGPLYPARVWIEQATLPSEAGARTTAEFVRLDARLADALVAAARGDAGAVQAALDSYRQIADDTIAVAAGNATLVGLVADVLDRHILLLSDVAARLSDKGNTTAATAVVASIARAIDHTQAAIVRLGGQPSGAGGGTGAAGGSGPGNGGTGSGSGIGAGGAVQPRPAASDVPKATKPPKPTATPAATPKPTPAATAKPTPAATVKPTSDTTSNKPSASPTAKPTPKAAPHGGGDR